ncbi:MAG: exodeoxyribonuclease III [Pseudomonadota bacterium]
MKIVSWNVNSIKARLDHVKSYLRDEKPDVLMVQELKGLEFPAAEFEALDYQTAAVPQKAYNGVAVFSKKPITTIHDALPGDDKDEQARYIEFEVDGLRLINIYAPNGNPTPGDKYDYKLAWMERLYRRLSELRASNTNFAIGGDFNVIPEAKDCHDPKAWADDALFKLETRQAYRKLINLGLTDAYRTQDNRAEQYTFWDYQRGAWQQNHGIRIDHFLLSPSVTDRLKACRIDREPRGLSKPSDHTPIFIEL